jgi:hypothetical protein
MSDSIAIAERIAWLIARYMTKEITPEELQELNTWVAENEENKRQFEKLTDVKFLELERERRNRV